MVIVKRSMRKNVTLIKTIREGFTLIEIMIAVAIVGLMLAIIGPAVYRRFAGATESAARSQMASLKTAIGTYYIDTIRYPDRLSNLIIKPPAVAAKWRGPYLEADEVPDDPWGNPYQYKKTPPGGKHPYELYSYGPNGKEAPKEEWIHAWK